jgi:hypothetical protein
LPLHLHALRGTRPRPSKPPASAPPLPPAVKPTLTPAGSRIWDQLAPVIESFGALTIADGYAFAVCCELLATMQHLATTKEAAYAGDVLKLERDTAAALRPYLEMFGLTPSSRLRLATPAPVKPASKWDGFLA